MAETTTPDLTQVLDRIRDRHCGWRPTGVTGARNCGGCGEQWPCDASRLLAAADAVLTFHYEFEGRCVTCREHCTCIEDAYAAAGFPDKLDHFQAEAIARAWSDCTHGNMPWPCPEYLAIARALTGTETADA